MSAFEDRCAREDEEDRLAELREGHGPSSTMNLYAIALLDGASPPATTIEFYWADDADHACEQAEDAFPDPGIPPSIEYVAIVPSPHGGFFRWNGEGDVSVR